MSYFAYTLIGDGPSDRALLYAIDWAIRENTVMQFTPNFASSSELKSTDLKTKISRALTVFPCDILFVHRDAERASAYGDRHEEIADSIPQNCVCVPVVPVRMTEAWILFNESAIRRAANNPNGTEPLHLPSVRDLDRLQDPKAVIFDKLRAASGLGMRRLRSFNEGRARARVAELIDDFSPLRILPAFAAFERAVQDALQNIAPPVRP